MNAVRTWSIVVGLILFIIIAPLATIGVLWHLHDATPHDTQWNRQYSEMTTRVTP